MQSVQTESDISDSLETSSFEQIVVDRLDTIQELQTYQTGFSLFFVIVVLCLFSYKFLRIFF